MHLHRYEVGLEPTRSDYVTQLWISIAVVSAWGENRQRLIRTFEGHADQVLAVSVTPDGRHVVSGSRDKTVKLWDLETGALIRTFEGHANYIYEVAVTPDGRHVVSGSRFGSTL